MGRHRERATTRRRRVATVRFYAYEVRNKYGYEFGWTLELAGRD